jgi:hypothetical protein
VRERRCRRIGGAMLPDHAAQSYTIAEVEAVIVVEGMSLHN